MRTPDGYGWQGDKCQKNVETIPSRISVQDTSRRTDSSVASREGCMTDDRASLPAASRQAGKFDVSARTAAVPRRARPRSPYAFVRHPMYATTLLMVVATPLALDSWWGMLAAVVMFPALIWRLRDEEAF
jgi:hypothetical protein